MKTFCYIALFFSVLSSAQETENSDLSATLKKADSLLFDAGFNRCDFKALDEMTHPELKFMHDVTGIQDKSQFIDAVRNNICSKPLRPVRKLIGSSLEVYPMYKNGKLYGAVQHGKHEFYQSGRKTGVAKFTHTWLLENGKWKLYHVISYDHQSAEDGK